VAIQLKEWRTRRALTLQDLSDRTGITKANISRIELGLQEPRASSIRKLAQALDITIDQLMGWNDATTPLDPRGAREAASNE
jgi:transcriptional regulator with XRE-family HTH domain